MKRIKERLEVAANLAVLVTCCVVLTMLAVRFAASRHSVPQRTRPSVLAKGESISDPLVDRTFLRGAQRTLLMYLRADCKFCAANVSFYQRLSHDGRLSHAGFAQIALLTSDSAATAADYINRNNLAVLRTFAIPQEQVGDLKLPGTPSLVLVGPDGIVKEVWIGTLDETKQGQVTDALFGQG